MINEHTNRTRDLLWAPFLSASVVKVDATVYRSGDYSVRR
jgi:hypothetical protein